MQRVIIIFIILFILLKIIPKIDFVAYNPPPIPELKSSFEPNQKLLKSEKILLSKGN